MSNWLLGIALIYLVGGSIVLMADDASHTFKQSAFALFAWPLVVWREINTPDDYAGLYDDDRIEPRLFEDDGKRIERD